MFIKDRKGRTRLWKHRRADKLPRGWWWLIHETLNNGDRFSPRLSY